MSTSRAQNPFQSAWRPGEDTAESRAPAGARAPTGSRAPTESRAPAPLRFLDLPGAAGGNSCRLRPGAAFRFRQLRRPGIRARQPPRARGPHARGPGVGVHFHRIGQLVSRHASFAHAGRAAFRNARGAATSRQRAIPRAGRALPVWLPAPRHRRPLAQRVRGLAVRAAPAARGIGGVGGRTEGRALRASSGSWRCGPTCATPSAPARAAICWCCCRSVWG